MKLLVPFTLLILFFLSSCGVITKARYGNGLKLNIESRWLSRHDQKYEQKQSVRSFKHRQEKVLKSDTTTILVAHPLINPEYVSDSASNSTLSALSKKVNIKNAISLKRQLKIIKPITRPDASSKASNRQVHPTVLWAAILFYGSIVANAIILTSGISVASIVFLPIAISYLLGFILAIVGLRQLQRYDDAYSGKFLAISIIALFSFFLAYFIVALAIFALFV